MGQRRLPWESSQFPAGTRKLGKPEPKNVKCNETTRDTQKDVCIEGLHGIHEYQEEEEEKEEDNRKAARMRNGCPH